MKTGRKLFVIEISDLVTILKEKIMQAIFVFKIFSLFNLRRNVKTKLFNIEDLNLPPASAGRKVSYKIIFI